MAHYTYRARTADGKEVKGKLRAETSDRAAELLKQHGLLPLQIDLAEETSLLHRSVLGGGVNTRDLILFSRQLASMIQAGVPVLQALQALGRQVQKPAFHKLLRELSYDVEGGESLSAAMSRHPAVFSTFFLGVVRTGEASGRLSESLVILSNYLEQNYIFTRKVRAALMYPIFVLSAVIIVVSLMFIFVVPQLVALFAEAEVRLPLPTRLLIGVTSIIQRYWYILGLITVVAGLLLRSYFKTPDGQYRLSTMLLQTPGLQYLFQKLYLARLTSILYTLFRSNVPILESLKLARSSIGNRVYQTILDDTIKAVKDGSPISAVWEQEAYMPPMLTTMVGVGERSGEIEKAFAESHRFFRRDVEEMLETISVFVEPVLVILLGIGVGVIVAAVLLPIYNLVLVL